MSANVTQVLEIKARRREDKNGATKEQTRIKKKQQQQQQKQKQKTTTTTGERKALLVPSTTQQACFCCCFLRGFRRVLLISSCFFKLYQFPSVALPRVRATWEQQRKVALSWLAVLSCIIKELLLPDNGCSRIF